MLYSDPFTVGKHQWRALYNAERNTWEAEFMDRCGIWCGFRHWPKYDFNNGQTLGLPKTVCRKAHEFWKACQGGAGVIIK